jgi:hypothetical protein
MTNLEALLAECEPYTVSTKQTEKVLLDLELQPEEEYSSEKAIAKAAVYIISRFLSLNSESEGGFSQNYDTEGLKTRIRALCQTAGIDASRYVSQSAISDGSKLW